MRRNQLILLLTVSVILLLVPEVAYATVETTLTNFGSHLATRILPLVAVLGLINAGFSFVTGNPNAKSHLLYAIVGVAVGLGAKSIVDMVKQLVQ